MEFLTYLLNNSDRVFRLTVEHVELVGVSILVSTAIGIPLGTVKTRMRLAIGKLKLALAAG